MPSAETRHRGGRHRHLGDRRRGASRLRVARSLAVERGRVFTHRRASRSQDHLRSPFRPGCHLSFQPHPQRHDTLGGLLHSQGAARGRRHGERKGLRGRPGGGRFPHPIEPQTRRLGHTRDTRELHCRPPHCHRAHVHVCHLLRHPQPWRCRRLALPPLLFPPDHHGGRDAHRGGRA